MTHRLWCALSAMALVLSASSAAIVPAGERPEVAARSAGSLRSVILLDKDWTFHPMPGFKLWAAQPQLTPDQIKQLHCPLPGKDWAPAQIPDDYVVRGEISPQPNPALLVDGAQCLPGGRECRPHASGSALASAERLAKMKHPPRHGRSAYGGHGYLPLYPAWYRREFSIPATAKGKSVWLNFGGVYRDAVVFVNGKFIAEHPSGYTGFRLDITSDVHYGGKNNLEVFVDPRWLEGWWYEGGGIYRQVRLMIADKLQVAPWGSFVIARVPGPIRYGAPEGDRAAADLTIQTTVRNDHSASRTFTLRSRVIGRAGKIVGTTSSDETLAGGQEATFDQHAHLDEARLWSLEHCNLYRLESTLRVDGSAVDRKLTTFGIRTIRFDPDHGFFLNGRHVEIQGAASHQDFPGVGIGAPDNLWAWRVAKLKAMGANAYRCSHNPVAQALYRVCDRMGMLVMDENRHPGDTYDVKTAMGTPYSDLSDLKWMILAHRNHPSIIMWSMGNEEGVQRTPYGAKLFAAMKAAVKKLDPARPTTSAMNGGYTKDGFLSVEDILGMNYHNHEFAKIHGEFPNLMIYGSEDINSKTSRGTLISGPVTGLCAEYGCWLIAEGPTNGGVPWNSWTPVMQNPFVAGEFIWTGFDYRGEPNPFSWPAVTSQTGAMDLAGFPKPAYYYWKARWERKPLVYFFPSWELPKNMVGKDVLVRAYSNCERVDLQLNGKSLGGQTMPPYRYAEWHVPYAPGKLTALGYDGGRAVVKYTDQTTGSAAALRLVDEVGHLPANGEAIAPIAVEVLDARGEVVSSADNMVRFSVSGAGTLAGVANGDPASHEPNVGSERSAFRGLCMVLVRAAYRRGSITVIAKSEGLAPARIVIPTF